MFINLLRKNKVTLANNSLCLSIVGGFSWILTFALYIAGLSNAFMTDDLISVKGIWITDVVVHVSVLILVIIDALYFDGKFWPLQMAIIGLATFVVFTLPALTSIYVVNNDNVGIGLSLGSLAAACLANAMMVSLLFELFHRGIENQQNAKQQKTKVRPKL